MSIEHLAYNKTKSWHIPCLTVIAMSHTTKVSRLSSLTVSPYLQSGFRLLGVAPTLLTVSVKKKQSQMKLHISVQVLQSVSVQVQVTLRSP